MITFKVDNLINMNSALQAFLQFLESNDVTENDVFDSRLVSCELISNVIRHCGEVAVFTGRLTGDVIEIRVSSHGSRGVRLQPTLPDVFAESGRGLYIVSAICQGDVCVDGDGIRACIKRK